MSHVSHGLDWVLVAVILLSAGCTKKEQPNDLPRLTPNVSLRDITFRSTALGRPMQYRVIIPANVAAGRKLPVVVTCQST